MFSRGEFLKGIAALTASGSFTTVPKPTQRDSGQATAGNPTAPGVARRFRADKRGLYRIMGTVLWADAIEGVRRTTITVNGLPIAHADHKAPDWEGDWNAIEAIYEIDPDEDCVELKAYQNTGEDALATKAPTTQRMA